MDGARDVCCAGWVEGEDIVEGEGGGEAEGAG